jgi:hypothetical protein
MPTDEEFLAYNQGIIKAFREGDRPDVPCRGARGRSRSRLADYS